MPGYGARVNVSPPTWTNPAATAALLSTVYMLADVEAGIVRNYGDVDRVRPFAVDLRSAIDVFDVATSAIASDDSTANDAFLPLLEAAGGSAHRAEAKLSSKELSDIWPAEGGDILSAIRRSMAISQHVADQLDPRGRVE
ncbi:MAG: hypothetical protein JWO69_1579 [Thermoleophilia bacterium]|jgi:hypothetical protein|nr:hypothetical protein [Thermoleophilia bacterium]